MNQKLQNIIEIIQQFEKLDAEQKDNLIKAVKDADKDVEITAFKLERTEKVKKTTAILLEETIEELEQKRKAVEEQNRELEIEAALERIRSRALGMHHSSEVKEVSNLLFSEFEKMNINLSGFNIIVFDKNRDNFEMWRAKQVAVPNEFESFSHKNMYDKLNNYLPGFVAEFESEWKSGKPYYLSRFTGGKRISFLKANSEIYNYSDEQLEKMKELYTDPILWYMVFFKQGWLGLICNEDLSGSELIVSHRFAEVFEFAYTRFLDIQKAEAQTRESEIQLALERVRARTMAMHRSDELSDTSFVLFQQFVELGIVPNRVFIGKVNEKEDIFDVWLTEWGGSMSGRNFQVNIEEPLQWNKVYKAWKANDKSLVVDIYGKDLIKWNEYLERIGLSVKNRRSVKRVVNTFAIFSNGFIAITTSESTSTETVQLLERFADVFNLTYRRFLDLQKAEAQVRESEIQLALERVRARTMAMHKSEELSETVAVLFQQFKKLGSTPERMNICHFNEESGLLEVWSTEQGGKQINHSFNASLNEPTTIAKTYAGWKQGKKSMIIDLTGKELSDWIRYLKKEIKLPFREELRHNRRVHTIAFFSNGMLLISTPEPVPQETINLLERFADVFNLTYRRFLDLQKAEVQARESEIQLALERVRARTMAMQKSDELLDAASLLFHQVKELGCDPFSCGFVLLDRNKSDGEFFMSAEGKFQPSVFIPNGDESAERNMYLHWVKGAKLYTEDAEGEELIKHFEYLMSLPGKTGEMFRAMEKAGIQFPEWQRWHAAYFFQGYLLFITKEPFEETGLFPRFASVFEQTYTRFLDLQKAEAQAREAEIETALERVRSRSMAMHKSDEISAVASVLFHQLQQLNIPALRRCLIGIVDESNETLQSWYTSMQGDSSHKIITYPISGHPVIEAKIKSWREKKPFSIELTGKKMEDFLQYTMSHGFELQKGEVAATYMIQNHAPFKYGYLEVATHKPITHQNFELLNRFANVFEQTYTRFLDLQKAEAQVREAQIEAALERIRSRALGMQSSDELMDVANILREQMGLLGQLGLDTTAVHLYEEDSDVFDTWYALRIGELGEIKTGKALFHKDSAQLIKEMLEGYNSQESSYTLEASGNKMMEFFQALIKAAPEIEKFYKQDEDFKLPEKVYYHLTDFSGGSLVSVSYQLPSNETKMLQKRAASVFDLAYRRYKDLKKAEEQAREAVKQASLDRVRGEIASMRTAEDLNRITPIIWRELKTLEVPFIRCGIFIIDEEQAKTRVYLTTPDGKSLGVLNLAFDANNLTSNTVKNWRKKQVYKEHWDKEQFINWTKSMMELGQVQNAKTYQGSAKPPESLNLHFVPFTQGMLYVGDTSPLAEEKLELVKTLAEAFSIAYARYEDFKNLEEAKNKIELTLHELKAAQAQLVHSEKMASLGELTAGIAHEIKNPLNFVNNFSEISGELLDEIKEELEKNDKEEILAILEDLKQNLEKINQHGKRADSIVKGMLLHSRGTSGEKTLIDINDLLEQYVNLAYHGMRAQNKEFNITIEKDFDETLEKINVVPQDISRVFLNIINNACYAAFDKKKKNDDNNFSPILRVSTKKLDDKVEIRIKDNGNGIPEDILDKIFQPFFTTKPTGEGTGLGLSLSYDIVTKVHGGELKVETNESEGSEFIINLNI